jgi:aldose 1-epimerase
MMTKRPFGQTPDGSEVDLYTLAGGGGMQAGITTYGGALIYLSAPDRRGQLANLVLGVDNLEGMRKQSAFLGALIGRYGNRIGHGRFTLDGATYRLPRNNGDNTLHGGARGFDKYVWKASERAEGLELMLTSPDGDEGFPGTLNVRVLYSLSDDGELRIDYTAHTDKPTVVNLTNHAYFNLAGAGNGNVLGHRVLIFADRFTPVDSGLIPTGELRRVQGTPFDFTTATEIGERINQDNEQLKFGGGYDHNWVLNKRDGGVAKAAEVWEPQTGRHMEVWTDQPGMQLYTSNFLDGSIRGWDGKTYSRHSAFCMETQHYPDSPNKPEFPLTELRPGDLYRTTTIYRFSVT